MAQKVLCRSKYFVPDQKFIYILCQTKRWFAFSKLVFCASTKVFEETLNTVKFLGWLKQFGFWTGTKHFGTCKRTSHKTLKNVEKLEIKEKCLTKGHNNIVSVSVCLVRYRWQISDIWRHEMTRIGSLILYVCVLNFFSFFYKKIQGFFWDKVGKQLLAH